MSIEEIRMRKNQINADVDKIMSEALAGRDEAKRVAGIMHNTRDILNDLDSEFERQTSLNWLDVKFLFLAVALQCARQYILTNDAFRLTSTEGDNLVKRVVPKNWQDILISSVPYDATTRANPDMESTGLSGFTHRYRTLGHDPIMGWIFGPMNILSEFIDKI
ncbi:hypothetical protein AGMMS49957_18480 [Synergistales bacterium]|nr:hypothetical protein AGMMS49957_18480 [Synergistales bacterium]